MLKSKAFVKRTKKGNVVTVVKEHYLRDDIYCGSRLCTKCGQADPVLAAEPISLKGGDVLGPHYLVPDTNLFLQNMDFVEHPAMRDVIILQTVLEEVKHRNINVYNRLRAVIANPDRRFYVFSNEHHRDTYIEKLKDESPNDRNDRAIRVTTKWYNAHLAAIEKPIQVVMLSNDRDNRLKATADKIPCISVRKYAELLASIAPEIVDLIGAADENGGDQLARDAFEYEEYLSSTAVTGAIKTGSLYQGSLQVNTHNVLEGYIIVSGAGLAENKIFIQGRKALNRAVQGDVVAVQLLPRDQWTRSVDKAIVEDEEDEQAMERAKQEPSPSPSDSSDAVPSGRVVGIIRRSWRPYCGTLDKKSVNLSASAVAGNTTQSVLFYPIDRRVPKIRIRTRQAPQLVGQRIIVAIDQWDRTSKYPSGHFVKVLGQSLEQETETEVILLEHGVPYQPFSKAVLNDLPKDGENWSITEQDRAERRDLRHLDICSIDPPGCTDIDDALHVRKLPNGNYEAGVHIADVTHFVRPRTAMDQEAAARGTTVYLVNKRIDMLPMLLGTNLCSLRSNVERFAFSCIWELNEDAEILNVDFTKSIILSKASLTYDEAQRRIDDTRMQDNLTVGIRKLNDLAKKLRAQRVARGALTLASPEVRFRLEGDAQDPVDVECKELKDTNALVEEFMLLANVTVAEKIFEKFPNTSMLRCHPTPPPENFVELNNAIKPVLGFELDTTSSLALSDSLDKAVLDSDPYFNKLLRIMTTRCMMQAAYFCSGTAPRDQFRHYGLATPIYTHFTSPIRRYADVIVHRLLAATIQPGRQYGEELTDKEQMAALCDNLNYRHRMAQQAGRASVELFTHVYFKGKTLEEEGYVTRILKNGLVALIPKYGVEGVIHTEKYLQFNAATNSLDSVAAVGTGGSGVVTAVANGGSLPVSLKLFSKVVVRVEVVEETRGSGSQKVVISLVKPDIGMSASSSPSPSSSILPEKRGSPVDGEDMDWEANNSDQSAKRKR
ncbi:exosome catalytic subunit dis3 [Sorochytrium milnesiophthora]